MLESSRKAWAVPGVSARAKQGPGPGQDRDGWDGGGIVGVDDGRGWRMQWMQCGGFSNLDGGWDGRTVEAPSTHQS